MDSRGGLKRQFCLILSNVNLPFLVPGRPGVFWTSWAMNSGGGLKRQFCLILPNANLAFLVPGPPGAFWSSWAVDSGEGLIFKKLRKIRRNEGFRVKKLRK